MGKYFKLFKTYAELEAYRKSENYITPNVSLVTEKVLNIPSMPNIPNIPGSTGSTSTTANKSTFFTPHIKPIEPGVVTATYNATKDNMIACWNASNVKSIKVDGVDVDWVPLVEKEYNTEILASDIIVDWENGDMENLEIPAVFPSDILLSTAPSSLSFRTKDENIDINELYAFGLLEVPGVGQVLSIMGPVSDLASDPSMGYVENNSIVIGDLFLQQFETLLSMYRLNFVLTSINEETGFFTLLDTIVTTKSLPPRKTVKETTTVLAENVDLNNLIYPVNSTVNITSANQLLSLYIKPTDDNIIITEDDLLLTYVNLGGLETNTDIIPLNSPDEDLGIYIDTTTNSIKFLPEVVSELASIFLMGYTLDMGFCIVKNNGDDEYIAIDTDIVFETDFKLTVNNTTIESNVKKQYIKCSYPVIYYLEIPQLLPTIDIQNTSSLSFEFNIPVTSINYGYIMYKNNGEYDGRALDESMMSVFFSKDITNNQLTMTSLALTALKSYEDIRFLFIPNLDSTTSILLFYGLVDGLDYTVITDGSFIATSSGSLYSTKTDKELQGDSVTVTDMENGYGTYPASWSLKFPLSYLELKPKDSNFKFDDFTFIAMAGREGGVTQIVSPMPLSEANSPDLPLFDIDYNNSTLIMTSEGLAYMELVQSFGVIVDAFILCYTDENFETVTFIDTLQTTYEADNGYYAYLFENEGQHTVEYTLFDYTKLTDTMLASSTLTSLNIPASIETIGTNVISDCSELNNITIDKDNPSLETRDCFAIVEKQTNTLLAATNKTIIPNTISKIGDTAFAGNDIQQITIPNSVESLGNSVFSNCNQLSRIVCTNPIAPNITNQTFLNIKKDGTLIYPEGSDYSEWLQDSASYLGYYGWNEEPSILTYTITENEVNKPVKIIENIFADKTFIVDGVEQTLEDGYFTFNTVGEHEVSANLHFNDYAMFGSNELTSIYISKSIKKISPQAFIDCPNLSSIIIDKDNSFYETVNNQCVIEKETNTLILACNGTTEIPENITSIADCAFINCNEVNVLHCSNHIAPDVTIASFIGLANYGTLIIPEGADYSSWVDVLGWFVQIEGTELPELSLNGYDMVALFQAKIPSYSVSLRYDRSGFSSMTVDGVEYSGTSYTFGNTDWHVVRYKFSTSTVVPQSAFNNCNRMHSFQLAPHVTTLNAKSFCGCSAISGEFTIPSSVKYIATGAFSSTTVTTAYIGPNVEIIEGPIFTNILTLNPLKRIIIDENNRYYDSRNNCNSIINKSTKTLVEGCAGSVVPNGVTNIGANAFAGVHIDEIVLPESVVSIGTGAFMCSKLKHITLTNKLRQIGDGAFVLAGQLQSINIPDSVTNLGLSAFTYCNSLSDVTLSNTITSIPAGAFAACSSLTNLTIPQSVLSIESSAFELAGLKQIIIPNSVTNIGANAFRGCTKLESIVLPEGLTKLSSALLSGCTQLITFNIPDTVTVMEDYVFANCTNIDQFVDTKSLQIIGDYCFNGCTRLTDFTIPDSVTTIGNNIFSGCTSLSSITIGANLKAISKNLFQGGPNISQLRVSTKNTVYDSRNNCNAIIKTNENKLYLGCATTIIPSTVTSIDDLAWQSCTQLSAITIPSSIIDMGNNIFSGCTNLGRIICEGIIAPTITNITFYNVPSYGILVYPEGADYSAWLNRNEYYLGYYMWNQETPIITCIYNVTATTDSTQICYQPNGVRSMRIDGGEWITPASFHIFNTLGEHVVEFENKGNEIASGLFKYCNNLKKVEIGYGITRINDSAFYSCQYLEKVIFPDSLTYIDNLAFMSDDAITGFTLPEKLTTIYHQAFDYMDNISVIKCYGLTKPSFSPHGGFPSSGTVYHLEGTDYSSFCSGWDKVTFTNPKPELTLDGYDVAVLIKPFTDMSATKLCNSLTNISAMSLDGNNISMTTGYTFTDPYQWHIVRYKLKDNTTISDSMFINCNRIHEIILGETINNIGTEAFKNCYLLNHIISLNPIEPELNSECFSYMASGGILHYPEGSNYDSWENNLMLYDWISLYEGQKITITNTYNVTSTTKTTKLCTKISGITSMAIDGVLIDSPVTAHTFTEIGEHVVTFELTTFNVPSYLYQKTYALVNSVLSEGVKTIEEHAYEECTNLLNITLSKTVTHINARVFSACNNLNNITLPNNLKTIGDHAFTTCFAMTELTIPSSVTSISSGLCYNSSGLTVINLSENITTIGANAFYGCKGLTNITLPDSITKINNNAFESCTGLTEVIIPNSVTSMGDNVFRGCDEIRKITLSNNLTTIGYSCFAGCANITEIVIPSSVSTIGNYAFSGCYALSHIISHAIIAPQVQQYTFKDLPKFGKLTYPEGSDYSSWLSEDTYYLGYYGWNKEQPIITCTYNVTYNGSQRILYNTTDIASITIDGEQLTNISTSYSFTTIGEHTIEFKLNSISIPSEMFRGITSLKSVIIPTGINAINSYAFYGSSLATIVLPNTIKSIGSYAFYNSRIENIVMPDSIQSLSNYAFSNCYYLSSVTLSNGLTTIGTGCFSKCNTLQEINIPDKVAYLPDYCFSGCTSLNTLNIGAGLTGYSESALTGVTSIDYISVSPNNAIYDSRNNCNALIETATNTLLIGTIHTIIPDTIAIIGKLAFLLQFDLSGITIPSSVHTIEDGAFYGCTGMTYVNLSDGLMNIGQFAFVADFSLTELYIPSTVSNINSLAFAGCSGITNVIVSTDNKVYDSRNNCNGIIETDSNKLVIGFDNTVIPNDIEIIGEGAFYENPNLTGITIPSSVHTIEISAFQRCYKLKTITIPDSVETMGDAVFYDCTALTEVVLSNNLQYIGKQAFYYCTSLEQIVIPDSVETIGESAFYYCSKLKSVHIPDAVTVIDNSTFAGCSGLTNVTLPANLTTIGQSAFSSCQNLQAINIPSHVTSIGYRAFAWCYALTSIVIPDSVTELGTGAFFICKELSAATLSNNITTLKEDTFNQCVKLREIVIPDSVETIENHIFSGCTSLEKVTIGNNVKTIGNSFLYNCSALTEVVIPDSVETIAYSFCSYCGSLTSVTLGMNLKTLGSNNNGCFYNCKALKEIKCFAQIAPSIYVNTFNSIASNGILYYPLGADYSGWLNTSQYYLGYYGWTGEEMYTPQTYYNLSITADNVNGRKTSTTIYWSCMSDGVDSVNGIPMTGVQLTGTAVSNTFEQNTSETESITRTITFEYHGLTASTTIIQGPWINQQYTIDLNNQWRSSSVANPDSSLYDGVYESNSNYNVHNSAAIMYIDIIGYTDFKFYVRSYAESSHDYVVVSNLDCNLTSGTTSGDNVKLTTKGYQNSGTAISSYRLVEFNNIDGGEHRITVMYRKDTSQHSGSDRGYLLIPKEQ